MVDIQPFKGLRYNKEAIQNDYAKVTAPPYDVISPEEQNALYALHPLNIVRLILGKKSSEDSETNSVYTRAKATLDEWLANGDLRPESEPAIYAYSQTWMDKDESGHEELTTRMGFIARLKVCDYSENVVLPHEFTLSGPKVDRLNLTRATQCTLSPIFCIYNDPTLFVEKEMFGHEQFRRHENRRSGEERRKADRISEGVAERRAHSVSGSEAILNDRRGANKIIVEAPDKVIHAFWPVTNPETLAKLQTMLADKSVIIADGHHRYETALAYQAEKGAQNGAAPQDYTLSFFCNTQSPGLRVYPTHRIIKSLPAGTDKDIFFAALFQYFEPSTSNAETVFWLQTEANGPKTAYQVKAGVSLDALAPELRSLDVAILDALVFEGILKTPANQLKQDGQLLFIRDDEGVADALANGALCAFWMHAPDVALVEQICQSGLRMPQKSTYFYPKLLSGLVIYPHELN